MRVTPYSFQHNACSNFPSLYPSQIDTMFDRLLLRWTRSPHILFLWNIYILSPCIQNILLCFLQRLCLCSYRCNENYLYHACSQLDLCTCQLCLKCYHLLSEQEVLHPLSIDYVLCLAELLCALILGCDCGSRRHACGLPSLHTSLQIYLQALLT